MALIKKTNGSIPTFRSLVTDLLDTEKLFNTDLLQTEWVPAVNVKEKKSNYEIAVAAPGLKKDDFQISVDNGILTISAEKEDEKEEKDENFTRREFSYNSFCRSFSLPDNANEEKINARYHEGVLMLDVAKKAEAKTKSKKITVA